MMVARKDAYAKLDIFLKIRDAGSVDPSSTSPMNANMESRWRRTKRTRRRPRLDLKLVKELPLAPQPK
eukprot:1098863-Amphidinium_carterae.1